MSIKLEKELEYLSKETGKETSSLLAEAIQEGVHLLYKRYVSELYMMEKIDRKEATKLLGEPVIENLDYAWQAVESDVRWGMKDE